MTKRNFFIIGVLLLLVIGVFLMLSRINDVAPEIALPQAPEGDGSLSSNIVAAARRVQSQVASSIQQISNQSDHRAIHSGQIGVSGVVLDQFDRPLSDIPVEFVIDQSTSYSSRTKAGVTRTDARGAFAISGYEGASIGILPKADGYVLVATNNRVIYSGFYSKDPLHVANSGRQRIIRMWKLQGGEHLVPINVKYRSTNDTLPLIIDLIEGKKVETGGDLKISVTRPSGTVSFTNRPPWSLRIEPISGGIIELVDRQYDYTFEAPTAGYQPEWALTMDAAKGKWFPQVNANFAIKTRGGKVYGKIGVLFYINEAPSEPFLISIGGLANPNSSRNLEQASR